MRSFLVTLIESVNKRTWKFQISINLDGEKILPKWETLQIAKKWLLLRATTLWTHPRISSCCLITHSFVSFCFCFDLFTTQQPSFIINILWMNSCHVQLLIQFRIIIMELKFSRVCLVFLGMSGSISLLFIIIWENHGSLRLRQLYLIAHFLAVVLFSFTNKNPAHCKVPVTIEKN